jgi:hypothetical protein
MMAPRACIDARRPLLGIDVLRRPVVTADTQVLTEQDLSQVRAWHPCRSRSFV